MKTEYEIAEDFLTAKAVNKTDFIQWFRDGGGSHNIVNTNDSRYLRQLKTYVAERDGERPATLPRILNKHIHGIPAGAVYIGRGSPWGNPFIIGRDGDRKDVVAKYDAWIDTQPHLLARLPDLRHRQLVCFCAPSLCHGNPLRRRANAPVCEAI